MASGRHESIPASVVDRLLASKVEVTPAHIFKLESGKGEPSVALLRRLAPPRQQPPQRRDERQRMVDHHAVVGVRDLDHRRARIRSKELAQGDQWAADVLELAAGLDQPLGAGQLRDE